MTVVNLAESWAVLKAAKRVVCLVAWKVEMMADWMVVLMVE